jgi:hypothetical protein
MESVANVKVWVTAAWVTVEVIGAKVNALNVITAIVQVS